MSNETKLRTEDILNKDNFENQEFLINNIRKSLKILKYVNENVIGKLNDKFKKEKGKPKSDETVKAIKDLEKDIKEAETKDALASTIISKNVSQEVLSYIRYLTTAYDILEKLKVLYGKKTNFREEKISMQCANNSICEFDRVGTYEGSINGYNIKFENVLYSKQFNKNLLSGIKLTKNGLKCNIKFRRDKVFLTLKTTLEKKRTINIGTFKVIKNNTIHILTYLRRISRI